ncbi:MAG: baseplate J/gp47 family protein [Hyphomicrobiaceae bacterium]
MPFKMPTLQDLAQRTANAFRANLKGSDARLWPNNVAVSAKVIAGAVWEPFAFLEYISQQALAQSAEGRWLDRHAAEFGMARLTPTYAQGSALISGDNSIAVPAGIILQRADGVQYEVTAGGLTDGDGEVTLPVRCLTPGRTGNAVAGVSLVLTAPLSRINGNAEVSTAGVGLGADLEGDESLRARILHRKRMPPHGGAAHDYVAWAREINGVTRVAVDPVTSTNNRTTVGVWFLMDDLYVNGIPQPADVEVLRAYIDRVRPAGALVDVAAPTPVAVNMTIAGLMPSSVAVRDAVLLELRDLFRRAVRISTSTDPYILRRSKLIEAISIAAGEDYHTLTTPNSDVTFATGHLPVLGTVTFA